MTKDETLIIKEQKIEVFEKNPFVKLKSACSIGNGILQLDELQKKELIRFFQENHPELAFFIPASGSGSRMFKLLFDYLQDKKMTPEVELFFKELKNFAFFQKIPLTVRQKIDSLEPQYIAEYLLSQEGMNFSGIPKGLIPFHKVGDSIYNPFQEQVLQASALIKDKGKIHFTIQEGMEATVSDSIEDVADEREIEISFSNQDKNTDAYCFKSSGEDCIEDGHNLRRPAGHGALIGNLNALKSDITLIKNIDNVQHYDKSDLSEEVWKVAVGLLMRFKSELKELSLNYSKKGLEELNGKYDFLSPEEVELANEQSVKHFAARPSRVCGMVKNEGKPGGGPFWIYDENTVTKQIIEGVQISGEKDQREILASSSHFNPVFIALSKTDVWGNQLDLSDFVDATKNLVVKKPHKGGEIVYRELPGLWNGAMSDWNSLFLEIPVDVFSPVKSILDLLSDAHRS